MTSAPSTKLLFIAIALFTIAAGGALRAEVPATPAPAKPPAKDDLPAIRKNVEKQIATLPVEAHFDQPYAGTTNPKQMVDLYLPKTRSNDKPLPVIVFIHGGGWRNGDRIKTAGRVLPFVATGNYAGVCVSYRLSAEAKWPAQIHDCKAAIRWVRGNATKYNLNPDRIAVWGGSAGGHLSSLLGTSGGVTELEGDLGEFTKFDSRVTCVANECGPQDFTMPLMFKDGKPQEEDEAVVGLLGGPVHGAMREAAIAASPVTYVSKDDAAFLTLHGTKDMRVDFSHAERIHKALVAGGVPSLFIPVKDGAHALVHPKLREIVGRFFDRHLRDMTVEIPDAPLEPVAPASATAK